MKKPIAATFALTVLMALCLVNVQTVKSGPKTIIVPDDYTTIQEAIDNAVEGDTVYVKKGVYVENPVVNKFISLVGEDMDSTVIDVPAGLKIKSNNVTITGFTVYNGWSGIEVLANYCRVSGNKIKDAQQGIVLVGSEHSSVAGNIIHSIGTSAAIQLFYSNNNLLKNNCIYSCTEGIQLRAGSSNNMVIENVIANCQHVAVRLLAEYSPPRWYNPNCNTIMRNIILNSGCGTTVYGASNNIITNNNYVNNTVQFSANEDYYLTWGGSRSINIVSQNYWSDYNGTDANGDGIGDTHHILDENNIDPCPLMKPVAIPELPEVSASSPEGANGASDNGIDKAASLPTLLVVAITVAIASVVTVSLLIYFKKRHNDSPNRNLNHRQSNSPIKQNTIKYFNIHVLPLKLA